jgi:hypothetical protein
MVAAAAAALAIASLLAPAASPASASAPRHYKHVIVVVMENLSYDAARSSPGYRQLAARWASMSASYASAHPSLPNYLDLTSGSTQGITSDCTSCFVNADNLAAELAAKHVSWGDFSEGAPHACFLDPYAGLYAGKHNPFRYYLDVRTTPALCRHLVGLSSLMHSLTRGAAAVPAFSFVTPNLCHDGHSCPPSQAFSWLHGFVGAVTRSAAWKRSGLLVVTWDEGNGGDASRVLPSGTVVSGGGGGHIPTLVVAPGVPRGTALAQPMSHESLLATIEANFAVPYLAGASAWASDTLVLPG